MTATDSLLPPHELLPHRYPFLLLDRITSVIPGKQARGFKQVTMSEWCVGEGHQPGDGAFMPHLLLVESLAQLSAALFSTLMDGTDNAIGYFMGIDRVRCRGHARPGDVVELVIDLKQFRRGVCKTHGVARVGTTEIVRADLTTILRAAPAT